MVTRRRWLLPLHAHACGTPSAPRPAPLQHKSPFCRTPSSCLLQVADVWTRGIGPAEYAAFIKCLLEAMGEPDPKSGGMRMKAMERVRFTEVADEAEEEAASQPIALPPVMRRIVQQQEEPEPALPRFSSTNPPGKPTAMEVQATKRATVKAAVEQREALQKAQKEAEEREGYSRQVRRYLHLMRHAYIPIQTGTPRMLPARNLFVHPLTGTSTAARDWARGDDPCTSGDHGPRWVAVEEDGRSHGDGAASATCSVEAAGRVVEDPGAYLGHDLGAYTPRSSGAFLPMVTPVSPRTCSSAWPFSDVNELGSARGLPSPARSTLDASTRSQILDALSPFSSGSGSSPRREAERRARAAELRTTAKARVASRGAPVLRSKPWENPPAYVRLGASSATTGLFGNFLSPPDRGEEHLWHAQAAMGTAKGGGLVHSTRLSGAVLGLT